jgi:hypothetical protein
VEYALWEADWLAEVEAHHAHCCQYRQQDGGIPLARCAQGDSETCPHVTADALPYGGGDGYEYVWSDGGLHAYSEDASDEQGGIDLMGQNEMSSRRYWDRREAALSRAEVISPEMALLNNLERLERRYNLLNYADRDAHTDAERTALDIELAEARAEIDC